MRAAEYQAGDARCADQDHDEDQGSPPTSDGPNASPAAAHSDPAVTRSLDNIMDRARGPVPEGVGVELAIGIARRPVVVLGRRWPDRDKLIDRSKPVARYPDNVGGIALLLPSVAHSSRFHRFADLLP